MAISLDARERAAAVHSGIALPLSESKWATSIMTKGTEEIEIVRDTWGVPHVFAKSELGALYGQGYAMAQDRLPTMMRAYRKAVGRMAEAFGPDWIEHDHQQRIWRHAHIARTRHHELPIICQCAGEAFVAGVKRYMTERSNRVLEWSLDVQAYHLVALSRYVVWGFLPAQAWSDLERAASHAPKRTTHRRGTGCISSNTGGDDGLERRL
jgi:acyl-homoserine lactone acylase PvdQ